MKKFAISLALAAVLLCSCTQPEEIPLISEEASDGQAAVTTEHGGIIFEIDQPEMFGVSGQTLYTIGLGGSAPDVSVKKYNIKTGEKISGTVMSDFSVNRLFCCDIEEQTAYIAAENSSNLGPALYKADMETGEVELLYDLAPFTSLTKLRKSGDTLYLFGITAGDPSRYGRYEVHNESGALNFYDYNGQTFAELDLASGEITDSGAEFPAMFDERGGAVYLYAFDEENGYYFLNYKTGEKSYDSKLGYLYDMTLVNDNGDFYFPDSLSLSPYIVSFYGIGGYRGVTRRQVEAVPTSAFAAVAEDGVLYTITAADKMQIMGFPVRDVDTSIEVTRIACTDYFELPSINGHTIDQTQLEHEGFALKILSLDSDYDIVLFYTDSTYAEGMKKGGSFYPLNDVEGVPEFVDRCFPYIKEAVTDENGDIWALPLWVDVPVIVYDEEHCVEQGITFDMDLKGFFDTVESLGDSEYYSYFQYRLRQSCFAQYLMRHDTFDTPLFREMAQTLKEHWDPDEVTANFDLIFNMRGDNPSESNKENFLFMDSTWLKDQKRLIGRFDGRLRASATPRIGTANPNGIGTFICVNPNSENLEETLRYVSDLTAMLGEENMFMFADSPTDTDDPYVASLLEIYRNGEISFEIPTEIYDDDFNRYLEDEITLDEFISEADRKLSIYLNE